MTGYNKTTVQKMRQEMEEALTKIAKKYDSSVKIGRITYGLELKTQITFAGLSENEHGTFVLDKKAQEFLNRAKVLGLRQDVLNEPCQYNGDVYKITGYNTRAKAYPIEFTKNGTPMKSSVEFMKKFVKAERPELFL